MNVIRNLINIVNRSFHLDYRSLAFTRIFFGFVIFMSLLDRMKDLRYHYTDDGIMSRSTLLSTQNSLSLAFHLINGTYAYQLLLFLFHCFVCLCIMVGWKTRLFCIIQWVLYVSLVHSYPVYTSAGDSVARFMSFFSMFLPLNKVWSVDALKKPLKKKEKGYTFCNFISFAFIIQVLILYLSSTYHKNGELWKNGSASYYAASHISMKGILANAIRKIPLPLIQISSILVLKWEFYGPLLYVSPIFQGICRFIGVFGFVMMHAGFAACIHLGLLTWVGIAANLPLLPSSLWDLLYNYFKNRTNDSIVFLYSNSSVSYFIQNLVRLFIPNYVKVNSHYESVSSPKGENSYEDLNNHTYLSVQYSLDKGRLVNFQAFIFILKNLIPVTFVIGWLLGLLPRKIQNIIDHTIQILHQKTLYDEEDRKLESLYNLTRNNNKKRVILKDLKFYSSQILALFIAISLIWHSLAATKIISGNTPNLISTSLRLASIKVVWSMYSPQPAMAPKIPLITGTLNNNETVEFFHSYSIVSGSWKPYKNFNYRKDIDLERISTVIGNVRWRKAFGKISDSKHTNYFLRFVCREYNKRNKGERVVSLKYETVSIKTNLDGTYTIGKPNLISVYKCNK